MHRARFPLAMSLILFGACQAPPSPFTQAQRDSVEAEVREAIEKLTEAMNAHDPDRVLSFYRESDEFVYVGCTDLMFGWDTFSTLVEPYYSTRTDVTFQRETLAIQALDLDAAVVTLRGSSTQAPALFWTQVLVREDDGRWAIAHEHESWPGCNDPPPLHPTGAPGEPGDRN
ncbi:YybH family protein [Gemmatimonadota bacterium]